MSKIDFVLVSFYFSLLDGDLNWKFVRKVDISTGGLVSIKTSSEIEVDKKQERLPPNRNVYRLEN